MRGFLEMPHESLVSPPGDRRSREEDGNGLLSLMGHALVVSGGTTAFPCVFTS